MPLERRQPVSMSLEPQEPQGSQKPVYTRDDLAHALRNDGRIILRGVFEALDDLDLERDRHAEPEAQEETVSLPEQS